MKRPEDDTQPIPVARDEPPRSPPPPSAAPLAVDGAGLTHPGLVRESNQDHFLVARVGRSLDVLATSLPDGEVPGRFDETGHVMVVADGMGGAAAGELASRVAVSTLVNVVLDVPDWIMKLDEAGANALMERAVRYYRKVDRELIARAGSDPALRGMGTTMTVAYCIGADLFVAHVGDSRAYLYRGGRVEQLTKDHTHVQDLVDSGTLTRQDAATHRMRHVLTNVLGGRSALADVELHRLRLADHDRLLICTDGLTEVVGDGEIAEVLSGMKSPELACRALIDLALERGAPDNATVVAARFTLRPDGDRGSADAGT